MIVPYRSELLPQLDMQNGEVLISVSFGTEIHLSTSNIYDNKNLVGYECVLMVEGVPQTVAATRHNETSVTCNSQEYTYEALVQEMNVTLTLKWNNDYIIDDTYGFTVTLYDCSINHRDCSECLSHIATRTPLQCGWCKSGSCEIESHCESDWWAYGTDNNCDKPTVTKVWPLSGPHEGNTDIIIDGTDLGKESSDIVSITVANLPCELLEERYTVSRRIECSTKSSSPDVGGDVEVTVRANNGENRTAKYSEQYTYRDPQVHDFTPKIGPESGGTIVSISGEYIDAGRIIEASFDGSPCLIDRMEDVLNETLVLCNTTSSNITDTAKLTMSFDGSERFAPEEKEFKYTEDPTVTELDPKESMQSGGRTINVTGTHFKSIQEPLMLITTYKPFLSDEPCVVHTNTFMQCITPPVDLTQSRRKKRQSNYTEVSVGFIMDAVESVRQLNLEFDVAVDPEYYPFAEDDNIREHEGQVVIQGKDLDLASTSDEVYVTIGQEDCIVVSLSGVQLNCIAPEEQPPAVNKTGSPTDNRLPEVRVEVGNLHFYIGYLRYPKIDNPIPIEIIAGVAAAAGLLIIIIIILLVVFQRRVSNKDKAFNDLQKKADKFQQDVRDECKRAFTELQTDMSDVTKDVLDSGIPFLDFNTYAVNMMFAGQSDHPVLQRGAEITSGTHAGLEEFYSLLANKNFCLVFIRTLEEQKTMTVRDRVNVGSLLTIILQGEKKMSYLTDVLKVLLAEAAEEAEEDNRTKSMLRRTESIMEKMLTNWFVLTLYPFIKICAGEPIFMLFKAMKYQIDKGPMDAIEGLAKYSLTDKYLLRENYDPEMLTINVVTTEDGRSEAIARVLDVDTISQVKDKLLDVIYKNHAYSKRPSVEEIDLEWRGGRQGQGRIILQDDDVSSELIGQWKRLNTLKHYKVPDEAIMALVNRTEQANGGIRTPITPPSEYDFINFHNPDLPPDEAKDKEQPKAKDEEEGTGIKRWHLIKIKGVEKKRKNFRERAVTRAKSMYRPERVISEIFLLQLVTTKGTVQEFVQHVFDALLTLDKQQYPVFPPPVKHMFDFLDDLAKKHGGDDDDVAHIWKSNSLPLRIWANMLKCPNCVFDINASQTVVASLDIVAQTFIDACSKIERKLGVQSPAVKLLYAKELPVYKEMVDTYYNDIRKLPSVSDAELNSYLEQNFMELGGGRFNRMVALNELYKYATRFGDRILDALENDKECRQMNLAFQLEQVSATMAENEYQTHKALKEAKAAERPNSDISHTSEPSSSSTQGDDHQGAYEINQGFTMATENHTDNQQNSEYELTQLDQQQNENQNDGKPLLPQKSQQPGFSYGFALPKV
ncbi:plexin-A4-like [Ptychodera flava]|uniref:plexin-A4-like n=1 Tax=Ptychodera flava TaxID=63121 RepID=UPI003969DEF2